MEKTNYINQEFDYRILVMHQLLDTAFVGTQHYVFRKSDPNVLPLNKIDSIFNYLALGHIHTHQNIQGLENREIQAIYSGSIERTSFAERLEKKGFIEVEVKQTEKKDYSYFETQYKFMELPTRPMYLINIEIKNSLPMKSLLEEIYTNIESLEDNSLIYIIVKGEIENLLWEKLRNRCLEWKKQKKIKSFKLKLNGEYRKY